MNLNRCMYIFAFAMPFFAASCSEKPVDRQPQDEASFVIDCSSVTELFDFGQTRNYTVEYSNVAELSVSSPEGWTADVEDMELSVTAPSEDSGSDWDEEGLVTVFYCGADGVEKEVSMSVRLNIPEKLEVTFELVYSDVTSTSARLEVIPSSNDIRYYYDVCTVEDYEDVNGDVGVIISQYMEYLLAYNPSLTMSDMLDIMLSQGPDSDTVTGLPSGTEMCFYAIAVDEAGQPYSDPAVVRFFTDEGGDPADCTFEMSVTEIRGTTVFIDIQPSDPSVRYWYAVTPRDGYPGDIPLMVDVQTEAANYAVELGLTLEEVIKGVTVTGGVAEYWYDLTVDTEYYLYAFAMDEQGNSLGSMYKEPFKTAVEDISDADVELSYKYYDGDQLFASNPTDFANAAGRVVIQVEAVPNLYTSDWAVALAVGDMTDEYIYPDDATINAILSSGAAKYNQQVSTFYANWSDCTILGFAADYNGINGMLRRIPVRPDKDGASPVEEFISPVTAVLSAMSVEIPEKTSLRRVFRLKSPAL